MAQFTLPRGRTLTLIAVLVAILGILFGVVAPVLAQMHQPSAPAPSWRERISERIHRLVSRRPSPSVEGPEDLDVIADIYRQASDQARQNVFELKRNIGDAWDHTRDDIADIWARAAQESERDVKELYQKAKSLMHERGQTPIAAEHSLEMAANRVQQVYRDAALKARARANEMSKDLAENWDDYRRRIAEIWEHSAREAEEQVRHLSRIAGDISKHVEEKQPFVPPLGFETERPPTTERSTLGRAADTAGKYVRDTAHKAADTLKEGTEKVAETTKGALDTLKNKIIGIYRSSMHGASKQVSQLKQSAGESWGDVQNKISEIYARSAQEAEEQIAALKREAGSVSGGLGQKASEGLETVKEGAYKAYETAKEGAQALGDKMREALPGSSCFTLGQWYERAMQQAREAVEKLKPDVNYDNWEATKRRISHIYEEALGDVDKRVHDLKAELDDAEHRKAELERTRERVRNLEAQRGESWESMKRRVSALYDEALQGDGRSMWQKVKGKVKGFFGKGTEEEPGSLAELYREASNAAKEKVRPLNRAENFDDLKRKMVDAFETAWMRVEARLPRKSEEDMTAAERRNMHLAQSYKRAIQRALSKADQMTSEFGEGFDNAKNRLLEVFETAFYNVESPVGPAAGEVWQSVKDKLSGVVESTVKATPLSKLSPKEIYGKEIANAEFEVRGLVENTMEPYSARRERIADMFSRALDRAEKECGHFPREVEALREQGRPVPPQLLQQYKKLIAYHTAMQRALSHAKSLKSLGEPFVETKNRVIDLFRDGLERAETEDFEHEGLRARFAQTLEKAAATVGLHGTY